MKGQRNAPLGLESFYAAFPQSPKRRKKDLDVASLPALPDDRLKKAVKRLLRLERRALKQLKKCNKDAAGNVAQAAQLSAPLLASLRQVGRDV